MVEEDSEEVREQINDDKIDKKEESDEEIIEQLENDRIVSEKLRKNRKFRRKFFMKAIHVFKSMGVIFKHRKYSEEPDKILVGFEYDNYYIHAIFSYTKKRDT
jgi:hypothetical protein